MCEDPKTGEIIVSATGKCGPGFIKHMRDKAEAEGITFLIPKARIREEE
jgi:hypothetical protein